MKAVITLEEHSPAEVEIEQDGIKRTIFMEVQKLADFIVSSVRPDDYEVKEPESIPLHISPTLPPNTVKYAKMSDGSDLMFMFQPQTKANVTYHGTQFANVPFPNLLFCFSIRNKRLVEKHVVAYKDRFLRDDTELFRFPYSNVFQGGAMCYHSNEEIHDLVQLQTFPHTWMNEAFNDHLYNQGATNLLNKPIREIFESTQGELFNFEMLAPMGITFSAWANRIIK